MPLDRLLPSFAMAGDWFITGANGQLGRALAAECSARGRACAGRDIDTLDIRDEAAVGSWIAESRPAAVINCAAFTAVDDCEREEKLATEVNGIAVGHLARACNAAGALLVQISTDYVFDGEGERPYMEGDPVAPRSAYGRSKLLGEELARSAEQHLIVRTAWLYGHGGRNFVEAIRNQLASGASRLRVVADQRGSPTLCDDLAHAVVELITARARGTVHAVNHGETTWHGFAQQIAVELGVQAEIVPVTSAEYPRAAVRPHYSVLDTSRMQAVLGDPLPTWQDALNRYLEGSSCVR